MKIKINRISRMVVHHVGNKAKGDGVEFGGNLIPIDDIEQDIKKLISKSFDITDLYHFYFESTVELNPIYTFVRTIFHDSKTFLQQTKHIAKILYECSSHPKIKEGELSLFYLEGCELNGEECDAIAIIKAETQQQLLQVSRNNQEVLAKKASGISLSKVEKGCLVFCNAEEQGYQIAIVDNIKKGSDSKYWKDSFLHIKSYNSPKHQTKSLIDVCNEFINTVVADSNRLSKVDKAMISVRAKKVLQDNETLSMNDYTEEVFHDYILETKFKDYVAEKEFESHIHPNGSIDIDRTALSKAKTKVETIKLDSNFDIRILGGQDRIVKGYDKNAGMNYYQLYFEEEN